MRLEINGIYAELGNSMPAITKKSFDPSQPSLRFIDFSNKFQLPDTEINRSIFESPKRIDSNSRGFNKLFPTVLTDVFILFDGWGFLESGDKGIYNFQIIDKSKELFKALEVKLKDISWDDKDTELSQTAINALDSVDTSTLWYWGKACYHKDALQINTDQTSGDVRCKYSRPCFLVQGLLKRAIENENYAFTAPTPYLAISSCHNEFYFTSYQKTLTGPYNPAGTLALSGLDTNDFEHSDLTVTGTTIAIGTFSTAFRLRGSVTSNAAIDFIIKATDDGDGTKITESKIVLPSGTTDIDFTSAEFQSDAGMTIDIRFEGTGQVTFDSALLYTILKDETEDLSGNPWLDYKIKAYDNLPDLTYLDMYKTVCVLYNKYHITDRQLNFEFGDFSYLNKLNALDWSEKFIINSEKILTNISGLAQVNYLKYSNDITVPIDHGQSYFLTDDESLENEIDYIAMKFGASTDVIINSNDVAHVPVYDNTTRIADQELSIRIFEIDSDKLQFAPLDWTTLKEDYYENIFNSLNSIRLIDCQMDLNKLDVLKWTEKQLIYIDYFKSTFLILEISNFIPGRPTNVKILRYGR